VAHQDQQEQAVLQDQAVQLEFLPDRFITLINLFQAE